MRTRSVHEVPVVPMGTRTVHDVPLVPMATTTNVNERPQETKRNADSSSVPHGESSFTDERRRQADDAIKIQLLEAFGKINGVSIILL